MNSAILKVSASVPSLGRRFPLACWQCESAPIHLEMRKLRFLPVILALSWTALAADFAPALQWVKTTGGSGNSSVAAAAADARGNLYIAGATTSLDFPTTAAAAQAVAGGSMLVRIDLATAAATRLFPANLPPITSAAAAPVQPRYDVRRLRQPGLEEYRRRLYVDLGVPLPGWRRRLRHCRRPHRLEYRLCRDVHHGRLQEHRWRRNVDGDQQRHPSRTDRRH